MHHPLACCCLGCRSRTGCTFPECPRSISFSIHPCRTEPFTITPTPIHIDNTITVGIVNNTIKRQQSRSMEMRYFWLLDGEAQWYFKFYYQPGLENLSDYPSKHHTADIHQHVRPYYVHMDNSPTLLPRAMKPSTHRGYAEILGDPYSKEVPITKRRHFPSSGHLP